MTRLYVVGPRCVEHTPARENGRADPPSPPPPPLHVERVELFRGREADRTGTATLVEVSRGKEGRRHLKRTSEPIALCGRPGPWLDPTDGKVCDDCNIARLGESDMPAHRRGRRGITP